jgi:hypothetical protein
MYLALRHCFKQVGFFKMIAMPLFSAWCKAFPECNSLHRQVHFASIVSAILMLSWKL